jgi:hypothetical protein
MKSYKGLTDPISLIISSGLSNPNFYFYTIYLRSSAPASISTTSSSPYYYYYYASLSNSYFQKTLRSAAFLISFFLNLNNASTLFNTGLAAA